MHIGLFPGAVPGHSVDIDAVVQHISKAEHSGFDSYWLPHLTGRGFDALTCITLAGLATNHIELGTAVVPTYPRHPTSIAQQAMTAQVVTKGRLALGIGPSHQTSVENSWGLSYEKPARHTREYLSVLKPLVTIGTVDFAGDDYQVNAQLSVPGGSPFPVLVSALAPAMLRVAGELADGTITWMSGQRTIASHIAPRINRAAELAGKPSPRICVGLPIAVTDDKKAAFNQASKIFKNYGHLPNYRRMLDIEQVTSPADVAIIGNEAEVEEQLRSFKDSGATDFLAAMFPIGSEPESSISRTEQFLSDLVGKI
ncbi:LLM class F420-dependent oxidoreductase [Dehalococcoidia bacterium]|nr:LLM class F420-dependent oxidoreductase [Dehalococcoidia bacterium]